MIRSWFTTLEETQKRCYQFVDNTFSLFNFKYKPAPAPTGTAQTNYVESVDVPKFGTQIKYTRG